MFQCSATLPHALHHAACGCPALPRRAALAGLGAALALAATGRARAASGHYDAMLVNCIDPRLATGSRDWMLGHEMKGQYSHFVIAGGPLGAVHPKFAAWHEAFWENLAISVQLHAIPRVVGFTHRDCGAAKLALGEAAVATPAAETASHAAVLQQFRAEVAKRQPQLQVITGIMAIDGSVEPV